MKNTPPFLILLTLCILTGSSAVAQIMLPPKPEKPAKVETERVETPIFLRGKIDRIPAKGWHFETTLGATKWGAESECQCNAVTADLGFYYINAVGLMVGTDLLVTNTVATSLSPTFKLGYQQIRWSDGSLGQFSTSLIAGPGITNLIKSSSISTDEYSGFIYGGEIAFHPRLGKYSELRGIMALGWLTQRETFISTNRRFPTETNMTHSGVRIRFGLTI